ncbi:MAG: DoxX family protein [Microvirga sp.]
MARLQAGTALAARVMLAIVFIVEAWAKLTDYAGTLHYMEAYGVPAALLPPAILVELFGGLLVMAGLLSRAAALVLCAFCLLTALVFHTAFTDPEQIIHFTKNLAMAGGFLLLAAQGPGEWSVEARLAQETWDGAKAGPPAERRT